MSDKSHILVTGGCGFLGWNCCVELASRGYRVTSFDVITEPPYPPPSDAKNIRIVRGSVQNLTHLLEVCRKQEIDKIIHGAAVVGYGPTSNFPKKSLKVNLVGTLNALEIYRLLNLDRFVFISSEEVYGEFKEVPVPETHPFDPVGIYAITKCSAEHLIRFYRDEYDLTDLFAVRTSWVYGPGLPEGRGPWSVVDKALAGEEYRKECGADQMSDKTYVDDCVQGIRLALEVENSENWVFNIGSGQTTSMSDLVEVVGEFGCKSCITLGGGQWRNSSQVDMPQKGALDISRARSELGYKPKYNLESGIEKWISSEYF